MVHGPRKRSESGFHHVVSKGDGSQVIFESDKDRLRYLKEFAIAMADNDVKCHAYCLMSNHVHLLVEDRCENLGSFMKQLNERYAMYYRRVTGRVGHVFRRPYWSEPIETDERFLCTVRYVHANPQVAGICSMGQFPWSSYQAYLSASPLVETELALNMLGGVERFEAFCAAGAKVAIPFPGSALRGHLSSDEQLAIAKEVIGRETLNALKTMDPYDRKAPIIALRHAGLTEREIARLTGLGRYSIQSALSGDVE